MKVIKDQNAGNSVNTYWRPSGDRDFCIELTPRNTHPDGQQPWKEATYARDSAGRVRRFASREAAEGVMLQLKSLEVDLTELAPDPAPKPLDAADFESVAEWKEAVEAAQSAPEAPLAGGLWLSPGQVWRHIETGNLYQILHLSKPAGWLKTVHAPYGYFTYADLATNETYVRCLHLWDIEREAFSYYSSGNGVLG